MAFFIHSPNLSFHQPFCHLRRNFEEKIWKLNSVKYFCIRKPVMGISERKERLKEDLKRRILDAARELFLEKGYEETSIRNIAEKIEYSPTTIYLHFKDKDALFHELHVEGFNLLRNKMQVLLSVADPMERLKAMAVIYVQFALEHRELYDLMFIMDAPMNAVDEDKSKWQEGQNTFDVLLNTIRQCMQQGHFRGMDPEAVAFVVWSTVHGMVSLHIRNRCLKVISECNHDHIMDMSVTTFNNMINLMATKE